MYVTMLFKKIEIKYKIENFEKPTTVSVSLKKDEIIKNPPT